MAVVSISDAEWQVMNVIWDLQPLTSQAVVAALKDHAEWAPATVKTMLHRLVRKSVLAYEQQGNAYVYRSAVKRSDCVKQASKSFLERVFDGESSSLVTHFLRNTKLSQDEIARLRKILDEQEARP